MLIEEAKVDGVAGVLVDTNVMMKISCSAIGSGTLAAL